MSKTYSQNVEEIRKCFPTRSKALRFIAALRWEMNHPRFNNEHFISNSYCPKGCLVYRGDMIRKEKRYYCKRHGLLFSPLYGTFLKETRLDLFVWFTFLLIIKKRKEIPSVRTLAKDLSVSGKTAHGMIKKMRNCTQSDSILIDKIQGHIKENYTYWKNWGNNI